MATHAQRSALVFGATGFIGRWLTKELVDQGVTTTAAVRSADSARRLSDWLEARGTPTQDVGILRVDLAVDGLGLPSQEPPKVDAVYNVAGAYAFGMTPDEAYAGNVDTSRRIVGFSATIPSLKRLVHLSGYRVGGQNPVGVPWSPERRASTYSRLGAYEASKVESDAVVQASARALGVPLTVANPSTVIGDSATGETDQVVGLATSVLDLLTGRLRALPGGPSTFVPVVTVDYLARFMVLLPWLDETEGEAYWILEDGTPSLPELLRMIGTHRGVRVPRARIPVGLIRRLPVALTHADPETLSFLSSDRYPTRSADELARAHGLARPDVVVSLQRWSDHLAGLAAS